MVKEDVAGTGNTFWCTCGVCWRFGFCYNLYCYFYKPDSFLLQGFILGSQHLNSRGYSYLRKQAKEKKPMHIFQSQGQIGTAYFFASCLVTIGTYPASSPFGGVRIRAGSMAANFPILGGGR